MRQLKIAVFASILFVFLGLISFSNVSMAAPQTLTILGGLGEPVELDPVTQFSLDNGLHWNQAYLYGAHPWGFIPGTNSYINCGPNGTDYCINRSVLYRIQFNVPEGFTNPKMTFELYADNYAVIKLNNILVMNVSSYGKLIADSSVNNAVHSGLNEIIIDFTDSGGWSGINYKITLDVESASPPTTVVTDTKVPKTTDDAPAGWVNQAITVTLTATDHANGSGVAATYYTVDGGVQQTGTSVVLTAEGEHTIEYWSVNNAGKVETKHSKIVKIDKFAPMTTDDAPTDWVNQAITVSLTAADAANRSGVAHTYYTIDGGAQQAGTSVFLTTEGEHTIEYWSVDNASNAENKHSKIVNIDTMAPTTIDDAPTDWVNQAITVNLTVTDSTNGSGVAHTYYTIDGGTQQTGTSVFLAAEGEHTIEYWSVDNTGNVESKQSKTVNVKLIPLNINGEFHIGDIVHLLNQESLQQKDMNGDSIIDYKDIIIMLNAITPMIKTMPAN